MTGIGAFVAVIGSSGAGKDSVIAQASRQLAAAGPQLQFPARWITRPPGPGEVHRPLSEQEFEAAERAGSFALTWRAHGLAYGIPAEVDDHIRAGGTVVVNVSRGVLPALATSYERLLVVRVSVPEALRLARLKGRGREDDDAMRRRIARADPAPDFPSDLEIVNDGTVEDAGARLVDFLSGVVRPHPAH